MKYIIDKHMAGKKLSHINGILNKDKVALKLTYNGETYSGILKKEENANEK